MNFTDHSIQKKIRGGDIGEFERLFGKYYGPLCHHANKILKDMDTAEDLVQEFFYQFWKNRESSTPRLSLKAYMYQSVRNNALHHLKHLAVRRNYADYLVGEHRGQEPVSHQHDAEMNDLGKIIRLTLSKMSERCAKIFRMNRFEGLKYREIAGILGVSEKTVEAEMGKALQLFRKSLKEYIREETS